MARSIEEIVAQAKIPKFDERLQHLKATYRFDIDGDVSYVVDVDHGHFVTREAVPEEPAGCVISAAADDFVRIIEGEQNLLTAVMQGRVRLQGDLAMAKTFHGFLPGRPGVPQKPAHEHGANQ